MSLLRAKVVEAAEKAIAQKRTRRARALNRAMFGHDGNAVPTGMVELKTPEDKQMWLKALDRQAKREQEGFAPGDVATRAIQSPIVQQGAEQLMAQQQGGLGNGG